MASSAVSAAWIPSDVRGLAYLAARQPAEAVGECQWILDHRSIVLVDPMAALARLQLARALALSGDMVEAKSAYTDLFMLWKSADPDIPLLKEARAEYARLPEAALCFTGVEPGRARTGPAPASPALQRR